MKILSHLAMAIALIGVSGMTIAPQSVYAQEEKKKKKKKKKKDRGTEQEFAAPSLAISDNYRSGYTTNNDLLNNGGAVQVKENLAGLELAIENDSDRFVHGNLTFTTGQQLSDRALQLDGIARMLNSPFLPAVNKPIFLYVEGSYAFDRKEDQLAITKLSESYDLGYRDGNIELLLGFAYNRQDKAVEAINWMERGIQSSQASGKEIDLDGLLSNMALAAINSNDVNLINSTFKKILPQTNANTLWHDALAQLIRNSNYSEQENLDILRLMRENDSLLFAQEYVEYVEAIDPRRLPNEVIEVVKDGVAKGHIPQNDITFKDFLDIANGRVAADKADLPSAEADARKQSTGNAARATADALFSYGEYQRAINMYQLAIEKGGINNDRALTRLGISQVKLGQYDDAKSSFSALTSPNRKNIGDYWMIYINNQQKDNTSIAAEPVTEG